MVNHKIVIQKRWIYKLSSPVWNDEFECPDGSHSASDIQDYFEHIIKQHEILTDNPPIYLYKSKTKNIIAFKIKTKCYIEFLTPETIKLLGK